MDILRGNSIVATVHPTDESAYACRLMGDNLVRLNFRVASPIDLAIGDYIRWRNLDFWLNKMPPVKEVSSREIEYGCEFQAIDYELVKTSFKLFDNTPTPLKGEFSYTGNAEEFVRIIVANLNRNDQGWTVGNVVETEVKTRDFSGNNCLEVLQRLASEEDTEYYITSTKVVNLCKKPYFGPVISLSYGMNNGLKWLRRIDRDTDPIITCLYAYGSAKNLPSGYRNGASRLMLPGSGYLLQNVSLYGIREGDKVYEEIYPRLSAGVANEPGQVTQVNGYLQFADTNLDFDVNDTFGSEVAKVAFNSGRLAGYDFEIESFDNPTKTYNLIAADKEGITLPSTDICFEPGDKYVLLNVNMPQAYVDRAELELAEKAIGYLEEYSHQRDSFNAECDTIHFKNNNIILVSGQVVNIQSSVLGVDREIRVIGFNQNINEPFKNELIEFGEKAVFGKIEKLSANVTNTAASLISNQRLNWQTTLELITLIKQSSTNVDFSNITGLPVDNEALRKYLNAYPDAKTQIISGAIVWDHDLTYQATDIEYTILGIPYISKAKEITLSPSDPALSRIDAFYVDVFANTSVMRGSPAQNPASPILNAIQLQVMTVLLGPGTTEPSDLSVSRIYDELAQEEWVYSSTQDTYISVDFNSNETPRIGTRRIKAEIKVPDQVVSSPQHYIGEKYQGGIIFYLDEAGGKKGLIVAEFDAATDVFYSNLSGSSSYTTGATGSAVGSGKSNTDLMLANDAARDDAAKYCNDLIVGTFDDWYLPSQEELGLIHFHRFKIGNLGSKTYWSSTESAWNKARCISFANGVAYTRDKNNRYCVRAIRSFDDTTLTPNKPVSTLTVLNTSLKFETDTPVVVTEGVLSLFIKSSLQWRANSMLLIESYQGTVKTGSVVMSPSSNMYGYKPESPEWQLVAIQMSNFGCDRVTLDGFHFNLVGSWPNKIDFAVDVIRYQYSNIEIKKDGEIITDYHFQEEYDGVRTQFTTSKPYKIGSTQLSRNGVRQFIGEQEDYQELNGKITLNYAPLDYEKFIITYKSL